MTARTLPLSRSIPTFPKRCGNLRNTTCLRHPSATEKPIGCLFISEWHSESSVSLEGSRDLSHGAGRKSQRKHETCEPCSGNIAQRYLDDITIPSRCHDMIVITRARAVSCLDEERHDRKQRRTSLSQLVTYLTEVLHLGTAVLSPCEVPSSRDAVASNQSFRAPSIRYFRWHFLSRPVPAAACQLPSQPSVGEPISAPLVS